MAPPKKNVFQLSNNSNAISQRKHRFLKKIVSTPKEHVEELETTFTDNVFVSQQNYHVDHTNETPTNSTDQITPTDEANLINQASSTNFLDGMMPFQAFEATPFTEKLRKWAITNNINRTHLNELLAILKPEIPSVPLSYRTLLETPRSIPVRVFVHSNLLFYYEIFVALLMYII